MSDTPRTDAESFLIRGSGSEVVVASLARRLECELSVSQGYIESLKQQLAELQADKERLDWLESSYQPVKSTTCRESVDMGILGVTFGKAHPTLRCAIDAAKRAQGPTHSFTLDGPASSDADHTGTGSLTPRRDGTGCRES